jgi:Rad3-related DNA helicase
MDEGTNGANGAHGMATTATDASNDTVDSLADLVAADLRAGGILSRSLPGYEERSVQIEMARRVADALDRGEHLICEASTGVGKSLAYLLPLVRSGKVALISTANKNLQEQLFHKDIPFVQRHIQPFKAALVKGMGNYLCLDLFEEERPFQQLVNSPAYRKIEEIVGDFDVWDGDLELVPFAISADLRGRLAADNDRCAWRGCPHFADCYVRQMRDVAREAQIIVVNHTLLLLDAAMGGWLLPERDVVVIDEAHHLEEEATRAFTVTVTPGRVESLMRQKRLRDNADAGKQQAVLEANSLAWDALARALPWGPANRVHLREPLQEGLRLAGALDDLALSLSRNKPLALDEKEEQLYEKLVKRARALAADARIAFGVAAPDERVYYVEETSKQRRRGNLPTLAVSAAPLSVAELLREKLFDKIPTLATSATLAVGGDFSFFRSRVGIEAEQRQQVVLPLVFDYRTNALLYLPRMRCEPAFGAASGPYLEEMAEQMGELVEAASGRAFLLFSSQNALRGVLERMSNRFNGSDYTFLVQGQDLARAELLRQFRVRSRAVLFGLKSFWEGVDVVGEALSLVVIDKLPFDPPDDPVNEARVNRMKAAGENWFGGYTLPMAVLRLKQGIGRLLRSKDDRGVMAILDKRLYTKSYGRQVLAALPPAHRTENLDEVRRFFNAG